MKQMERLVNRVKEADEERARNVTRRAVNALVRKFGYERIRNELRLIKRDVENEEAAKKKAGIKKIHKEDANYHKLLQIWLAVEKIKGTGTAKLTAKAACETLARDGGIMFFDGGNYKLGLTPSIDHWIANAKTIEREYKRAEQLRKNDKDTDAIWRDCLADVMGNARPSAEIAWEGEVPSFAKRGKKPKNRL